MQFRRGPVGTGIDQLVHRVLNGWWWHRVTHVAGGPGWPTPWRVVMTQDAARGSGSEPSTILAARQRGISESSNDPYRMVPPIPPRARERRAAVGAGGGQRKPNTAARTHQAPTTGAPVALDFFVTPGPYPVGEVKGRCPAGLDDFVGVASFTVIRGGRTYRVFGTGGELDAGVVRFGQQDLDWDGRDIRIWLITATPNGIVADPTPINPSPSAAPSPGGRQQEPQRGLIITSTHQTR